MTGKMAVSDKALFVKFDAKQEPQFEFRGAWNIRDLGRTRSLLLRAYKHYMRELRSKEVTQNERPTE
jgi:hypothetical protein